MTQLMYVYSSQVGVTLWLSLKMGKKQFLCAQTRKPLAGAFGDNQSHNSTAFQFCQPPFTGLYPISPRVLLNLTRVLAYFPHILGDSAWSPQVHLWESISPHGHHGQLWYLRAVSGCPPFPTPAHLSTWNPETTFCNASIRGHPKIGERLSNLSLNI